MGGWREPAARAGAGVAIGAALVAAAVVLASTYVVLVGHVGDTSVTGERAALHVDSPAGDRRRLRRGVAAGGGLAVAGGGGRARVVRVRRLRSRRSSRNRSRCPSPQLVPEPRAQAPAGGCRRSPAGRGGSRSPSAAQPPEHVLPADISSPSARARAIYAERLSFSPRARGCPDDGGGDWRGSSATVSSARPRYWCAACRRCNRDRPAGRLRPWQPRSSSAAATCAPRLTVAVRITSIPTPSGRRRSRGRVQQKTVRGAARCPSRRARAGRRRRPSSSPRCSSLVQHFTALGGKTTLSAQLVFAVWMFAMFWMIGMWTERWTWRRYQKQQEQARS